MSSLVSQVDHALQTSTQAAEQQAAAAAAASAASTTSRELAAEQQRAAALAGQLDGLRAASSSTAAATSQAQASAAAELARLQARLRTTPRQGLAGPDRPAARSVAPARPGPCSMAAGPTLCFVACLFDGMTPAKYPVHDCILLRRTLSPLSYSISTILAVLAQSILTQTRRGRSAISRSQ